MMILYEDWHPAAETCHKHCEWMAVLASRELMP